MLQVAKGVKKSIKYIFSIICSVVYRFTKKRYSGYKVYTREESLNYIIKNKISLARFGDGELRWMVNLKQTSFQTNSDQLAIRLQQIIKVNDGRIGIAINDAFVDVDLMNKTKYARLYWKTQLVQNGLKWTKYLSKDRIYFNTGISRFYIDILDCDYGYRIVELWKKIWDKKNIIIVEGEFSRSGVGNGLFDNVSSIRRVIVPATNAFDYYDEILKTVRQQHQAELYLLAIGPTATVLAYDLTKLGYWAIDIGHLDLEYEWLIRQVKTKTAINYRAVNECSKNIANELPDELNKEYKKQIVSIL